MTTIKIQTTVQYLTDDLNSTQQIPDNCILVTDKIQTIYKKNNRIFEHLGVKYHSLSELVEAFYPGYTPNLYSKIHYRIIQRGMPIEEALKDINKPRTTPNMKTSDELPGSINKKKLINFIKIKVRIIFTKLLNFFKRRKKTAIRKRYNKTCEVKEKRLRSIINAIRHRCYNSNSKDYKYYGGKGIVICKEWNTGDSEAFINWSLANGYNDNLILGRKYKNGPYSPENCLWTNNKANQKNKAVNINLNYQGVTYGSLIELVAAYNLNYDQSLYQRIHSRIMKLNWPIEDALNGN